MAAPLLVCCAATATARPSKRPPPPSEVIEIELSELGGRGLTREFLVPLEGKIAGSVTLFEETGRCEFRSRPLPDERFNLEIRCSHPELSLDCTRSLTLDAPTIIGELEVDDDRRMRVLATRR